ncbi:hypothetical protein AB9N12_12260 [Bacteroides sp. AN502(2024)]|uniref:hypothetical protein n=1 Tax=Bacteroides sp. AN502(2024) TaxID=3160599 RepID=UPI003513329D
MKIKYRYFVSIAIIILASCSDPEDPNDIYVCGNSSNTTAFYWVNGAQTPLSPEYPVVQVSCIQVVDNDIYCGGYIREQNGGNATAACWKNGKIILLTDGSCTAYVHDFCVKGGIIYCVGNEYDGPKKKVPRFKYSIDYDVVRYSRAKLWRIRDGEKTPFDELTLTPGERHGSVESVYMDPEGVLHLAGYDEGVNGRVIGTLGWNYESRYWQWKDGALVSVEHPFRYCSQATTVFGSGTDIFIGGWVDKDLQSTGGFEALYKKDGWEKILPDAFEVTIEDGWTNGSEWYMCGYDNGYNDVPHAYYYKNGQPVELYEFESAVPSAIHSIAVVGKDVYMSGHYANSAGYWKNGKFIGLEGVNGDATGIVVIPSKTNRVNETH